MKLEILPKGLSLTYTNDILNESNNYFIPFTSIVIVGPIELDLDKSTYDYWTNRYYGEYISKVAYFTITASDHRKFDIYINEDIKKFPRKTNKDSTSIWKKIFFGSTDRNGLSKEAKEFAITEKCEEAVKHLAELRNNVIEAINKEK